MGGSLLALLSGSGERLRGRAAKNRELLHTDADEPKGGIVQEETARQSSFVRKLLLKLINEISQQLMALGKHQP